MDPSDARGDAPARPAEGGGSAGALSGGARALLAAALLCLGLGTYWTVGMDPRATWGWDETMHAELPAVRLLFSLQDGDPRGAFAAVLACDRYPFVYPVVLAASQAVFGASEQAARAPGIFAFAVLLFGLFLLGRELARGAGSTARAWTPWLAVALGAASPLALGYAGTTFLEVPFTAFAVLTLVAWTRREHAERRLAADLLAGTGVALCLFTKWNYGLLLAAGLALDFAAGAVAAGRRGSLAPYLSRALSLVAPPAALLSWWFVWPLPAGLGHGAQHRDALASFLSGNLALGRTSDAQRLLTLAGFFSFSPRALAVTAVGLAASLRSARRPPVRALWLVLLATAVPVAAHDFFLDRFLVPAGAGLWPLAAVGLAGLLPRRPLPRGLAAAGIALFALLPTSRDTTWLAARLGLLRTEPEVRAYQVAVLAEWQDLSADRKLRSSGLPREEAQAFLDAVADAVGPEERVGWIGMTAEVGPFGLLFGLWERGGSRARLLADAPSRIYVALESVDPGWSDEELAAFAGSFDVLIATDPPHMRGRADRAFARGYQERLVQRLGWTYARIGELQVARSLGPPVDVKVIALRPR